METFWIVVAALVAFFFARAVARSWAARRLDRLRWRLEADLRHRQAVNAARRKAGQPPL